MQELDDLGLLRAYVERDSEEAFATLVERHINKVYSVALRHTGNPHQAEEITQAVFVILARKSWRLSRGVILYSWLYKTARLTSAAFIRSEIRRTRREQEACMQNVNETKEPEVWLQIAPLLDAALAALNETDRRALVLRFFYGKSMKEIGTDLGANEDAIRQRVGRALEKLRHYFLKRGIRSTPAMLAETISTGSVQAAPAALAKSVTAMALAKGAAAPISTLTLVKGALKIMAWTKAKTAIVVGVVAILAATSTTVIVIKVMQAHNTTAEPTTGLSPFDQTTIADIQPNGTILLQDQAEETNDTSQTIKAVNINDGDGISRATDESGNLMRITKRPRGGVYLMLNKAVPPGGTVSYTAEGKLAGFISKNAAGEYELNIPYGDIGNVTEAHVVSVWRLPAGAVLVWKSPGMEETIHSGRIELRVNKIVPPNGRFSLGFRYRLPANAN